LPQLFDNGGAEQEAEELNKEDDCETQRRDDRLKARKVSTSATPIQVKRRETD
jgi:hypothetical protein